MASHLYIKFSGTCHLLLICSYFCRHRMMVTRLVVCFAGFSALAGGVILWADSPRHRLVSICLNFQTTEGKVRLKRNCAMQSMLTLDLNFLEAYSTCKMERS